MADTIARGRRAKHIDHFVGPGLITRHIGTRLMVIPLNGREFQRDAGMIILEKPIMADYDPIVRNGEVIETQLNNHASRSMKPLQEGEYVIMKDDPNAVLCGNKENIS